MRKHQCFALHWLSCNLHTDFKFLLAMVSSGLDLHILHRLLRKKKIALYVYCFIQAQSGTFWGSLEPLYGVDMEVHMYRLMYNGGCGHPERAWFMCQDEHVFFFSMCGIFLSESMYCFLSPHSLQHSLNHLMMELQPTSFMPHSPAHSPNSLTPQWPSTFLPYLLPTMFNWHNTVSRIPMTLPQYSGSLPIACQLPVPQR